MHTRSPDELQREKVEATDLHDLLIDDFTNGWQDWYVLEAANPHHWEFSTRKLADPKWQGQAMQKFTLDLVAEKSNELVIVLTENFFRSYRGKSKEFVSVVKLNGGKELQTVSLKPMDFKTSEGEVLSSWKNVDVLSFRAYYEKGGTLLGSKTWAGSQPKFRSLRWEEE